MSEQLPVADKSQTWREAKEYLIRHRRSMSKLIVFQALAALAGLAGPQIIGQFVNDVQGGTLTNPKITATTRTMPAPMAATAPFAVPRGHSIAPTMGTSRPPTNRS